MSDGELQVKTEYVPHESKLTAVLLRVDEDDPGAVERIDGASLGDADLDADKLREAWESEILRQAEWIQEERREKDDE